MRMLFIILVSLTMMGQLNMTLSTSTSSVIEKEYSRKIFGDKTHIFLKENSTCGLAFPRSRTPAPKLGQLQSIFNFTPMAKSESTLRLVNAGTGTTGTKEVYFAVLNDHGSACHWLRCEPRSYLSTYSLIRKHFETLKNCVEFKSTENKCKSINWIDKVKTLILEVAASGVETLHDIPNNFFIREYLDLVPDIDVVQSVRDPFTWTLKRFAEHPTSDILCDMRLNANRNVTSPFHILECLHNSKAQYVFESLTFMQQYINISTSKALEYVAAPQKIPNATRALIDEVAGYYTDYSERVMNTAAARARHYRAVCVWDENFP